jgi:hypothetical protein
MKYWVARLIGRLTYADNHMWTWSPKRCWQCGKRTWWKEINFEAPTHRGKCTRRAYAEYFAASNEKGEM